MNREVHEEHEDRFGDSFFVNFVLFLVDQPARAFTAALGIGTYSGWETATNHLSPHLGTMRRSCRNLACPLLSPECVKKSTLAPSEFAQDALVGA
jgi:hypothetical protein